VGSEADGAEPLRLASVKLHYLDQIEQPRAGFIVSTVAGQGSTARGISGTALFDAQLGNFLARFREDFIVQRRLARQPLFDEADFVTKRRASYVSGIGQSCEWMLYRHTEWPFECTEVPLVTSPPVRVCIAAWRGDVGKWLRTIEVIDTKSARAVDDRRAASRSIA
jgi:hypothetical protein